MREKMFLMLDAVRGRSKSRRHSGEVKIRSARVYRKMKKIAGLSLLLIALMLINGGNSQAQTASRIQFAKGKTSAVVKGNTGNSGVAYVVRAKSGQKLVLSITPAAKVGIKVETEGKDGETVLLREERGGIYEIGLEEGGDYTIFIGSTDGRPVLFTLSIKITKLTDI